MMTNEDMIDKLNSLIQLDIDAVQAYEQALDNIDMMMIRIQISDFRDDHQAHIRNLSALVHALGGKPTEYARDFKGFLIEGFTSLRSATGTEGALKAMETNEKLTNSKYENALSWDLTVDAKAQVRENYNDERRHLTYIQQTLKEHNW
ncbi:MAG TPA: DUF2383 domain-containing protein [Thermodesulfobacteriota bacterium]|mgnify:FL=1|nr:DUF2383 domain-containing protein [Thermodesulfobacteriota bacterium]HNU71254.1 DUF2383 domain-containing protein [Thermodesulfobacteriota bacterium]HOC39515.1 DUF2383 domain-containing protein [Thermodesulfobacteriota bacterium]